MALAHIISAIVKSCRQLTDAAFRGILFKSLSLTVLTFLALIFALSCGLGYVFSDDLTLPYFGTKVSFGALISWSSFLILLLLSIFLMVPVATLVSSFFLEDVAAAVEAKHYSYVQAPIKTPAAEVFKDTINFLGVQIIMNLLALFLSIFFLAFAPLIFWALNGFLLGREYFQMVAMRHLGRQDAQEMRRRFSGRVWLAGIFMAAPLSVPILNLFVPLVGVATFTHLFHRWSQDSSD
jgi:CysZ protein